MTSGALVSLCSFPLAGISSTRSSPHSSPHSSYLQQQSAAFNFAPTHSTPPPPPSPLAQQLLAACTSPHSASTMPAGVLMQPHQDQGSRQYPGHQIPQDQGSRQYPGHQIPQDQGTRQYPGHQIPQDQGSRQYPGQMNPQDMAFHNLYHLGNSVNPMSAAENAMLSRTFFAQQQHQQQQHQQLLLAGQGRLASLPALHQLGRPHSTVVSGRYAVGSNIPPSMPGQVTPTMAATAAAAAMVGRVRAPVPSNVQLQDSTQRDSPPTPHAYGQSHLQNSPSLPQRTHLPSQQVT